MLCEARILSASDRIALVTSMKEILCRFSSFRLSSMSSLGFSSFKGSCNFEERPPRSVSESCSSFVYGSHYVNHLFTVRLSLEEFDEYAWLQVEPHSSSSSRCASSTRSLDVLTLGAINSLINCSIRSLSLGRSSSRLR